MHCLLIGLYENLASTISTQSIDKTAENIPEGTRWSLCCCYSCLLICKCLLTAEINHGPVSTATIHFIQFLDIVIGELISLAHVAASTSLFGQNILDFDIILYSYNMLFDWMLYLSTLGHCAVNGDSDSRQCITDDRLVIISSHITNAT